MPRSPQAVRLGLARRCLQVRQLDIGNVHPQAGHNVRPRCRMPSLPLAKLGWRPDYHVTHHCCAVNWDKYRWWWTQGWRTLALHGRGRAARRRDLWRWQSWTAAARGRGDRSVLVRCGQVGGLHGAYTGPYFRLLLLRRPLCPFAAQNRLCVSLMLHAHFENPISCHPLRYKGQWEAPFLITEKCVPRELRFHSARKRLPQHFYHRKTRSSNPIGYGYIIPEGGGPHRRMGPGFFL